MNGLHSHKCLKCEEERECPKVTHCKQPFEVEECYVCYASRTSSSAQTKETKHTPGQLTAQATLDGTVHLSLPERTVAFVWDFADAEDIARRIAALWNEAERMGLTTEAIEQGVLSATLAALKAARVHVWVSSEAEHMLDGFGPRSQQPSDSVLAMVDAALALAAPSPETGTAASGRDGEENER